MAAAATQLTALLDDLAKRASVRDVRDFSVVVGLVSDLGRLVTRGSESDIRQAQAAVSAVREQLRDDERALGSPTQTLAGPESRPFLAGALWAISEMMTTRLDAMPFPTTRGRVTRRVRIREMVLEALASGDEPQSPTAILESIVKHDGATRFDEVSRALTEMLAAGLVHSLPSDTDRRMKYLELTPQGRSIADKYEQKGVIRTKIHA
ncbi:hypothetical protein [Mycobacterium sp. E2733]|uniref:hypothetical protein n=1 Tax=Mycobacterium sp. E2733 TaxID=1834138 RepID=UPI0007FF52EC|nr:hypothetical protein [Mycobacterium sp. E2733]OBH90187.1 hypothetical protein A5678_13205 [Mycobacterium sp. E2733]